MKLKVHVVILVQWLKLWFTAVAVHPTALWGEVIIRNWKKRYCSGATLLLLTTKAFCMRLVGASSSILSSKSFAWHDFRGIISIFSKDKDPFFFFKLEGWERNLRLCWFMQIFLWKSPFCLLPLQLIRQVCKQQIFGVSIREDEMLFSVAAFYD